MEREKEVETFAEDQAVGGEGQSMEEKITKDEMIQRTGKALLKFLEDVVEKGNATPEEITAIPGVALSLVQLIPFVTQK